MSSPEEVLLGKAVFYFDDPTFVNEPVYAQIVEALGYGYVTLMVPRPRWGTVEFKNNIELCMEPTAYHWMDISTYMRGEY